MRTQHVSVSVGIPHEHPCTNTLNVSVSLLTPHKEPRCLHFRWNPTQGPQHSHPKCLCLTSNPMQGPKMSLSWFDSHTRTLSQIRTNKPSHNATWDAPGHQAPLTNEDPSVPGELTPPIKPLSQMRTPFTQCPTRTDATHQAPLTNKDPICPVSQEN